MQLFVDPNNASQRSEVVGFTEEAMSLLQAYSWPGNVRELRNVVERSMLFARDPIIAATDLPPSIRFASDPSVDGCPFVLPEDGVHLESVERGLVVQAIDRTNNNQTAAAKLLGISRYALRNRMKKFGLL